MKGEKQVREWSHMLGSLKNLGNGQYEIDKRVLPVLRSSYDFLTKKLQRFFLYYVLNTIYGSFYDDDATNSLIRRFVYESIDETKKLRVLYNEGYNMLYKLKHHSMLDQCHERWGMNKFLRALAINIAEDTGKIMAKAYKNLTEIPSDDQWKDDLQKEFLMGNMIQTIPNGTCPRCSLLSTLLLDGNANLNYIPDDFFNKMPALKTLDLSQTSIKCLPKSVSSLICLNALLLSGCKKLSDIPPLENLKRLILLDLSLTAITEANLGLESLINLRCLNLPHMPKLVKTASDISNLINLECLELHMIEQVDTRGLKNLEVIVADFHDIHVFNSYMSLVTEHSVLRSYVLTLRDSSHVSDYEERNTEYSVKRITIKDMNLKTRTKAILPEDMKELIIKECCQDATSLCSALSRCGKIERLDISNCKDVKSLCCLSCQCPFCSSSQLVGLLRLSHLKDLKDIVSSYPLSSLHQNNFLFSHLTHLHIQGCDSMETLMTSDLVALFHNLRTILVNRCMEVKEIVGDGRGVVCNLSPPIIALPRLTSLELQDMPQLKSVYRHVMQFPSLQTFSFRKCKKLKPPRIVISEGFELTMEKTSTGYHWQKKTD